MKATKLIDFKNVIYRITAKASANCCQIFLKVNVEASAECEEIPKPTAFGKF